MRNYLFALAGWLLLAHAVAADERELPGQWLMKLPAGAMYQVVIRPLEGQRFRLEKGVRFNGEYELRDKRLVLVNAPDKTNIGFEWEVRSADELVLVSMPPEPGGSYLGATLKRQSSTVPGPPAKVNTSADRPPTPALNLAEKRAELPGQWLLTLPTGAMYQVIVRGLDDQLFRLEKAARFSGAYEIRDNRFVTTPLDADEAGFAWELRGPDELVLVAQSPKLTLSYLGAILKRQSTVVPGLPAPAGPPPVAAADEPAQAGPTPRRATVFAIAVVLALVPLAVGMWLIVRRRAAPRKPGAARASAVSVSFACPGCETTLKAGVRQFGKNVKCPECGLAMQVPKA